MTRRYYTGQPLAPGPRLLQGPEAHHLLHVMRAAEGDSVILFDGRGAEADATILSCSRNEVALQVEQVRRRSVEPPRPLHLGVALPKGDRQKWLVEKCVELGVASLTPLTTRRSVARPGAKSLDRLRRSVIEASKQCGRNQLMEISQDCELSAWLKAAPGDAHRFLADPGGDQPLEPPPEGRVFVAIGPEGGFAEEELEQAGQAGWRLVGLGPRVLRVETAAVAVAARLSM